MRFVSGACLLQGKRVKRVPGFAFPNTLMCGVRFYAMTCDGRRSQKTAGQECGHAHRYSL